MADAITSVVFTGVDVSVWVNGAEAGSLVVPAGMGRATAEQLIPEGHTAEREGVFERSPRPPVTEIGQEAKLVYRHGNEEQRGRYKMGALLEEEIRELARNYVLGPAMLDQLGRSFDRLVPLEESFSHKPTCSAIGEPASAGMKLLRFSSGPAQGCRADQFIALEQLQSAAAKIPYPSRVVLCRHEASCKGCGATRAQLGALVATMVAGRTVSREYSLERPKGRP